VRRIYAIGDIHGRVDLLDQIIDMISADVADHGLSDCLTVTLGDYVDRGMYTKDVIERLCSNPFPTDFVALKGNHEDILLRFLSDPSVADHWRSLGGLETLYSYGVPVTAMMRGRDYSQTAEALVQAMPVRHLQFLQDLKTSYSEGRYFFCHAGVRPGVPLERQSPEDLMWIRNEFLSSASDFGKIIVHGHTPHERPELLPNRINIDTGAYASGRLTCVMLPEQSFFSTEPR